ncbi:hypothetical protein F0L74_20860 [Chitinophaga agrisoli]|uniref:Membrane protein DUF2157 n=1 Tax=Chitinophaga agrisoli TaxID=2607653 RepID=A0A5B2VK55_9BACT|nr:hypothetical protein [Chitinophaga agrisoli]KAA2238672.1 hypothetical protein F0L74_20860 [Chitinophaga agrisoli]
MLAYNRTGLDNAALQEEVSAAFHHGLLSGEEKTHIKNTYPASFYTPNIFIRIGLFLLTTAIVCFACALLALMFLRSADDTWRVFFVIMSILSYAALEYMVYAHKHHRSGVDDALLWCSCGLMMAGCYSDSEAVNCLTASIISLYAVMRFADQGMSIIATIAIMGILFYAFHLSFIVMIAAAIIYAVVKYLFKDSWQGSLRHYASCATIVEITTLVILYTAGNYWVAREIALNLLWPDHDPQISLPGGWFYWTCTTALPLIYLIIGIRKKDAILLRTGLVLIAASILTFKSYYHLGRLEVELTLGGIALIGIAYSLIRYLHIPRHGFTSYSPEHLREEDEKRAANAESLVITESFTPPVTPPGSGFEFGGGTGGGGGAQGQW